MCVCVCVFFGAMKGRCQLCGRHWKVDLNARIPMLKYLSTTYKNKLVRCGLLQWGRRFCSKVLPHPRSNPFNVEFIMKESNRASWNLIWMWIKVSHMMLDKDYPFYPPPPSPSLSLECHMRSKSRKCMSLSHCKVVVMDKLIVIWCLVFLRLWRQLQASTTL